MTRPLRPVTFGDRLRLSGGWVDGEEIPAGDVVRLTLEWEPLQPLPVGYKASLRLVGLDGQRTAVDFDLVEHTEEGETRGTADWAPGSRVIRPAGDLGPGLARPPALQRAPGGLRPGHARPRWPRRPRRARRGTAREREATLPLWRGGGGGGVRHAVARRAPCRRRGGVPSPAQALRRGRRLRRGAAWSACARGSPIPAPAPSTSTSSGGWTAVSGTEHRSTVSVVDGAGTVWVEETRSLFGGTFAMHDWREGETLAERRAVDLHLAPTRTLPRAGGPDRRQRAAVPSPPVGGAGRRAGRRPGAGGGGRHLQPPVPPVRSASASPVASTPSCAASAGRLGG